MTTSAPTQTALAGPTRTALATGIDLYHHSSGDPDGSPVVFLHGVTDSSWSFSRIIPLLPSGHAFHAVDLRGHGRSSKPEGAYDIDTFAADVVAFLDGIGAGRATVVGHSLGTIVARRVAQRWPDRVHALALLGPVYTPVDESLHEFAAEVAQLPDPVPVEFVHEFQASTIGVPVPPAFYDRVIEESMLVPAYVWHGAFDGVTTADDAAELTRMDVPTWLLWGEDDAYFGRDQVTALAAGIRGSRLIAYPETGHAVHWERPEAVARDLGEFLRLVG